MPHPHWPFFDLVVRTPRLELRYPDDDLLVALADLAAGGIHPPEAMPFYVPWTRQPAGGPLERGALQHHWLQRATLAPERWDLPFAVLEGGEVVGLQAVHAEGFPVRRTVDTGSWLGRAHQGRGIGTEMRAAVLELCFAHLGAAEAETGCWVDNPASERITRKLGYLDNGSYLRDREGVQTRTLRFRLPRSEWRSPVAVTVEGLGPCLPLLGLGG